MKDRPYEPGRETPPRGDNKQRSAGRNDRLSETDRDASARANTKTTGTTRAGSARADAKTTQVGTGGAMREKKTSAFSPEPPPQDSLRSSSSASASHDDSNANRSGTGSLHSGDRGVRPDNDNTGINSARMSSEERTRLNNTPPGADGARRSEHHNETQHHAGDSNHPSIFGRIKRFVSDRLHTR